MTGWWKRFDWLSLAVTLALIGIGTVAIRSAGCARAEVIFHGMWVNNLVTAGVGLVLYFVIAAFDYRKGLGLVAVPAYLVSLVLLVTVLLVGSEQFGGKRWLWFFQPSEVSKLCVISLVAVLFGDDASRLARLRSTFWGFLLTELAGLESLGRSYLSPFGRAEVKGALVRPRLVRQKWRDGALKPMDDQNQR